jgi:NADPH:quinone reductase-like Zn-dependent oxidoreductase
VQLQDPAEKSIPATSAVSASPTPNRRVTFTAYGGPEVISLVTEPLGEAPGKGMARIRVAASSLVFTDMLIRRNLYPMLKTLPGETLGYDIVGHVDALGPDTAGPEPGTLVAALTQVGGGQDWVNLPADSLVPLPGHLDPVQIEPLVLSYMTAYQCLVREARVERGAHVLVIAATGAVGLAALDLARALGLRATGVASSRRRALVEEMGAAFIAYDAPDAGRQLDVAAKRLGGFAVILDGASNEPLPTHLRRLAKDGHYVAFGFTAHLRGPGINAKGLRLLLGKLRLGLSVLRIVATRWRNGNVHFYDIAARRKAHPDWFREDLATLAALLSERRIAPHISGVFPPERASEAHALIEEGSVVGRLVLDMRSNTKTLPKLSE